MCPSRAISFSRRARIRSRSHADPCQTTPAIIDMYNKTNRSSTDISLSVCICRSPSTGYKWESFATHAILDAIQLIIPTTRVYTRSRIYVYVTILTDFFASSPDMCVFVCVHVRFSRATSDDSHMYTFTNMRYIRDGQIFISVYDIISKKWVSPSIFCLIV